VASAASRRLARTALFFAPMTASCCCFFFFLRCAGVVEWSVEWWSEVK
jgi:hypothetical protein